MYTQKPILKNTANAYEEMSALMKSTKILWQVLTLLPGVSGVSQAADNTLIDYFLPMPVRFPKQPRTPPNRYPPSRCVMPASFIWIPVDR
jgi:hypothetical protein